MYKLAPRREWVVVMHVPLLLHTSRAFTVSKPLELTLTRKKLPLLRLVFNAQSKVFVPFKTEFLSFSSEGGRTLGVKMSVRVEVN